MENNYDTICGAPMFPQTWIFCKNGIMTQIAELESKKPNTEEVKILHFSDVHINLTNKDDEGNEEVMYTKQCRKFGANGSTIEPLKRLMKYGGNFDQIVITGDTLDYLTCGAMEAMQKNIWDKDPKCLVSLGNHDLMRQMETGLMDKTPLEERQKILEKAWKHDMYYVSKVLKDKVMVIVLDNGQEKYWDFQVEKLERDIKYARENNIIILVFQHNPICTGRSEDEVVKAFRTYDGDTRSFYSNTIGCPLRDETQATKTVYRLLTENSDVIKGFFSGHYHSCFYTEIDALYFDENGNKHKTLLPQYTCVPIAYDNYAGHVIEITVK